MSKVKKKWPDNNLRQLREAAGLTLEQLAEKTVPPTSFAMIAKLERGERELRREWIKRISLALHCNENEIIIFDDKNGSKTLFLNRSKEDPVRGQLDEAIKLWFNNGNKAAIRTLAIEVYKALRPEEAGKDLSRECAEHMMVSSILRLQSLGITLTTKESAFMIWLPEEEPGSIKKELRTFFREIFPIESNGKERKPVKSEFFRIFTGNSLDS